MAATDGSASSGRIILESDGDLILIVGLDIAARPSEFLVYSRALSRASRVFKVMLDGGFKESRPIDPSLPWVVTLPDDNPEPAKILFDSIHGRAHYVPRELGLLSTSNLYNILVLADKYDMTKLLQP